MEHKYIHYWQKLYRPTVHFLLIFQSTISVKGREKNVWCNREIQHSIIIKTLLYNKSKLYFPQRKKQE